MADLRRGYFPEIKESALDDGQSLPGVLLTPCTYFYYDHNEAGELKWHKQWIEDTMVLDGRQSLQYTRAWSYYLGEEMSQLPVNCLSVWHIIRVYVELIPTLGGYADARILGHFVICTVLIKFQCNVSLQLPCSLHSHPNLHHTVQARRKPFSSLLLLLLLLWWVQVHSSPATTEAFFVSPRPLSLAPLQHTHIYTHTHTHTHRHTHTHTHTHALTPPYEWPSAIPS